MANNCTTKKKYGYGNEMLEKVLWGYVVELNPRYTNQIKNGCIDT